MTTVSRFPHRLTGLLGLSALLLALAACRTATPAGGRTPDLSANKLDQGAEASLRPPATAAGETADEAAAGEDARAAELNLADQELAGDGEAAEQVLSARAGQTLWAEVKGVSQGAVLLEFLGPDGQVLASNADAPAAERNRLSAQAAEDGEHRLRISAAAGAPTLSYDLRLWTEAAADGADEAPADASATPSSDASGAPAPDAASPADAPRRIRFQTGSDGGSVKGSMAAEGELQRYLLEAAEGQVLVVTLTSDPVDAVDLMVFSPEERPLRPLAAGDEGAALRFPLPQDGDYTLSLSASQAASWTLELRLEAGGQSGIGGGGALAVGSAPTRLIFGPGNLATRVQGQLSAAAPQRFVLRGEAGQTLALSLEAAPGPQVYVEDHRGKVLAAGSAATPLNVALPASQDYWVTVLLPPRGEAQDVAVNIGLQ